jgi:hypothetical protein
VAPGRRVEEILRELDLGDDAGGGDRGDSSGGPSPERS